MPRRTRASLIPLLLLLTAGSLQARTITWEEAPQYQVDINGKPDMSTVAWAPSSSTPHLIVTSSLFSAPLLIDLRAKAVLEISVKDLKTTAEFIRETADVPKGRKVASYTLTGGVTKFGYKGRTVTIRIKESLIGEVGEAIILAHSPVYALLRDAYKPAASEISFLKSYRKKTELVVMFATWCPTCRIVLPRLLRILKDAANPNISVRYIGIAMGGNEPHEELEKYGHDYPAVIVFQDGREVRRIIGDPPAPLEKVLAGILKGRG